MDKNAPLIVTSLDLDRLERLMESLPGEVFPGRSALEAELTRAEIVEPADVPPDVVSMNSTVKFTILDSNQSFTLTLVYPKDMDSTGSRISITAPVGSALLGLRVGDRIEWPKPGGGQLQVQVDEVSYQPERAGELHR